MSFKCIELNSDNLDDVAVIHANSYPVDHISGSMGHELIVKYYSLFVSGENLFFGCVDDSQASELLGFVVFGTGLPDKIAKFKIENRINLVKFFVFSPYALFLYAMKRISSFAMRADRFDEADNIILSIAVTKNTTGVGSFLMSSIDSYCHDKGISKIGLYVACSNVNALNFYCKTGFKVRAFVSGQYYMEKNYEVSQ